MKMVLLEMSSLGKLLMATCHLCGAETQYYKVDLPTCPVCSAGLTVKPQPTPNDGARTIELRGGD